MASQDQQTTPENSQKSNTNTSIASGAKTAAAAVSAAAKAASGNVAGAIKDLLKDENIRRIIVTIILGACFMGMFGAMMMGSAITGTIESLKEGYLAKYNELYEKHAIEANGSTFALYNFDQRAAQNEAMAQAIVDTIKGLFQTESAYDNDNIPNVEGTQIDGSIYDSTLNAVKDQEAFIDQDGALLTRLNMIKGRVEQRGKQLANIATGQYELSALGMSIGAYLDNLITNPILFAGIDFENSTLDINSRAFEISDIQALKILAAYSIQNDCNLQNIDMWDLMNYCGWYATDVETLPTTVDTTQTIYDTALNANYGMEIGGAVAEGDVLSYEIHNLAEPYVPYWDGSCAAQWYYEEIAQLRKNNELYDRYAEQGNTEALQGMIRYAEDSNGDIILSNFDKLSNYDTFGIVDQIYTTTAANIVVSRTEYHNASEWYQEALTTLTGSLRESWVSAFSSSTKYTSAGNRVYMDSNGNHSFTLYGGRSRCKYYIRRRATGWRSSYRTGNTISFSGLTANATYDVYELYTNDSLGVSSTPRKIDSFTTFSSNSNYEAYKIQLNVNVTYGARSVDQMVETVLGLWPGSLSETEIGSDGRLYADGNANNDLLALTWTDTYTDSSGQTHTISFKRNTGYQKEAYQDYILAIADALGFDTTGIFGGDLGYGQTIVDIAMAEYEFYHQNNLFEGGRYWDMVYEATGARYPADTPWCACFVMTCAWQCGLLGEGNAWEGVDWIYYCSGLYYELVNSGVAEGYDTPGSDYKPVPGDIVFFAPTVSSGNLQHVGLVKEVTEDGRLVTIEGNKSDILRMDTYSGYTLGTHAYSDCVIAAYCHPQYPATYLMDPLYENISNAINPSINARIMMADGQQMFLAGMGRLRWSQISTFLDAFQAKYPELYEEDLRTAYEAEDMQGFISAWNAIARSSKKENFKTAQRRILNEVFVQPIANAIKAETGFDWKKSNVREQVLLGIVTTTDQQQACISVLSAISTAFNNSVTDTDFLNVLNTNNFLYNYISANRNYLWPEDSASHKEKWCLGIQGLLNKVIEKKDELNCYELEVEVTHYCACTICCGPNARGITASGKRVEEGMIATSSYYPFGTKFRINGILYTVEDRGGSEIENSIYRVDIYVPDHNYALQLGRYKTTAIVYPVN